MKTIWLTIIVALLVTPLFAKPSRPHGYRGAQATIQRLSDNLETFKTAFGRNPTTEEGLEALFKCPADLPQDKWPEPHFLRKEWVLNDPWGHPYVYRCPGLHLPGGFDLYSCGRDGVSASGGGDDDDINNWDPNSPRGWTWEYASAGWQVLCIIGLVSGIIFLLTLWKELRRSEPSGNLHGILAMLLVLTFGFPPMGLLDVMRGPISTCYGLLTFLVGLPVVVLLQRSAFRGGSAGSKTCAKIATALFILLLLWSMLIPAEAQS
jgi:general secretion pathway protein G